MQVNAVRALVARVLRRRAGRGQPLLVDQPELVARPQLRAIKLLQPLAAGATRLDEPDRVLARHLEARLAWAAADANVPSRHARVVDAPPHVQRRIKGPPAKPQLCGVVERHANLPPPVDGCRAEVARVYKLDVNGLQQQRRDRTHPVAERVLAGRRRAQEVDLVSDLDGRRLSALEQRFPAHVPHEGERIHSTRLEHCGKAGAAADEHVRARDQVDFDAREHFGAWLRQRWRHCPAKPQLRWRTIHSV
eukprot:505989-Prymnesium_polylepis.3